MWGVKGLQKLTSIRLAEVLTQKGVIPAETITDALYVQDKHGDLLVENLISSGHISEWDLARVVVENFQLPFILAGNYDISNEARDRIDRVELFQNVLVPLDVFGEVMTIAMPILTPYPVLHKIQKQHKVVLFPYVSLISENKKILGELFSEFNDWIQHAAKEKAQRTAERTDKSDESEGDWMNIFDSGEKAVRSSLGDKKTT